MSSRVSPVTATTSRRSGLLPLLIGGFVALLVLLWSQGPQWLDLQHLFSPTTQFWMHAAIDASIGLSYLAISASLVFLVYRARDAIPYHHVFLAFGGFILSCGLGHFSHIWTMVYPASHLEGYVGVVTAASSIATAVVLPPLIPKALHLIESAKVSEQRKAMIQHQNDFFTTVTHELKTPLTAMLGFEELLKRRIAKDGTISSSITSAVTMMGEQTQRLARLIDSLLDLSRIQQGKFIIQRRPLEMRQLVSDVVARFRVTLTSAHELHLDAPTTPAWIDGDDLALEQLLFNLLQNAVKYSPNGGSIQVALEQSGNLVRIRVADQGIGIPLADQEHLFEQFYRAGNIDGRKMSGFGVGLHVSQEIVRQHGGRVEVESTEGVGSTFTVVLPLISQAEAERRTTIDAA